MIAITTLTGLASVIVAVYDTDDQTLFTLCYGAGAVWLFMRATTLNIKHNSRNTVLLLETSMLFYGGGFLLWLVDRNFCPHVHSLYLHAWWHVGADIGTFTGIIFWIWMRQEILSLRPQLHGRTPA